MCKNRRIEMPEWWIIALVVVVIVAAVWLGVGLRVSPSKMLPVLYRNNRRKNLSKRDALKEALLEVGAKKPLDKLAGVELLELAFMFSPLPDPTVLAEVLREAERRNDISMLRDMDYLNRFCDEAAERQLADTAQ
jgi:hypothetical protein